MALLEALLRLSFGHQAKLSKFVYHGSRNWVDSFYRFSATNP